MARIIRRLLKCYANLFINVRDEISRQFGPSLYVYFFASMDLIIGSPKKSERKVTRGTYIARQRK